MVADNRSRRLPPKVIGCPRRKRKKVARTPWYRHFAWLSPTVACVIFAVLIAGAVGVRQVVILLIDPNTKSTAAEVETAAGLAAEDVSTGSANDDLLKSSEPGLEVLPPPAAKQPGRKLPKMLLVGRHPAMFQSLAEAMQYAIGGDIIEIRDNGPLFMEPGKAVWEGKEGTLTIRGGKQFQPVLAGTGNSKSSLLRFGKFGQTTQSDVAIRDVSFVHNGFVVKSYYPTEIQRCGFFVMGGKTLGFYMPSPESVVTVEQCYFWGLRMRETRFGEFGTGRLVIRNNLFVTLGDGRCLCIGIPSGSNIPSQASLDYCHNTEVHSDAYFAIHSKSIVRSTDNLFANHQGCLGEFHSKPVTFKRAQELLDYRGEQNLYFPNVNWEFRAVPNTGNFTQWQRLTNNGEQNPTFADPLFVNPQLVMQAKDRILPPSAFALRADSPAKGAATNGTDIGCDLSRIPTPPPMVEQLIQQALQSQ